jgi:hypothetical protein
MTELQLRKFISTHNLEIAWRGKGNKYLFLWMPHSLVSELTVLMSDYFDEYAASYNVSLQEDCIAIDIVELCEYFNINPDDICAKGSAL